ncbi:glycoside hydrolase family 3 C-terminal domain-containing protein [Amycolatopsis sp. YIM 10]|uniref:glycoside hydrolase family 3 C-terminal domain-containing protein n=1 Tax=Amycolatopsis sp. YIM 10 TaxID=2653857 RepID=UPI0012908612|nr:glycoside hydrolase family 3 C-terminal domain-containing protein [Amycolatopsis sp. YIM 10]QFU92547.1 Thermostable beta-glucosidase B [Amycolatopsis sp. YIM 10]
MPQLDPAELSLERKAALLTGADFWSTAAAPEAGVVPVVLSDGPHGVRRQADTSDHLGLNESLPATCFPPAVAVGSSWDREVAATVAAAVAREGRALGADVVLGPGVNIKRTPLCGRNFEYYSEDPYLSGVLGAAYVRALQAEGVGASVKHFAVNNQETERMRISADVDERTLREIYLAAFERVVTESSPATVMCSYNKINGVYAAENHWLLTRVLREEWGFSGAVVSDWGAVGDRVAALAAGTDLEMPGTQSGAKEVIDAVRSGRLAEAVVDDAVRRVADLSRFARVTGPPDPQLEPEDIESGHDLARLVAAECAVLLRNKNAVLPIEHVSRVAVVGEFAVAPSYQGGGSSHINPTRVGTALDTIREHAAARGQTVVYAPGFHRDGSGDPGQLRADAVEAAADADVALVFAGIVRESEGFDRDDIDLPADQVALIDAVAATAARTVVVLSNGGVVSLEGWHDHVDAILEGWLLGQAGGPALADLLYGVVNPSGHLAETIPLRLADTPAYLNFPGEQGHVRYGEGVMVGYRHYLTAEQEVRYPFGHGLSYTTFTTTGLAVTATGPDTARLSVTVTNTGPRAGKHVVQVYVATSAGPVRRPVRELRAFEKVELAAGESRTLTIELDRRAFAYWDIEAGRWVVAPGEYVIQIGENAASIVAEQALTLDGELLAKELTMRSTVGDWFDHPVVGPRFTELLAAAMGAPQPDQSEQAEDGMKMARGMPLYQFAGFLPGSLPSERLDQLIELSRTR